MEENCVGNKTWPKTHGESFRQDIWRVFRRVFFISFVLPMNNWHLTYTSQIIFLTPKTKLTLFFSDFDDNIWKSVIMFRTRGTIFNRLLFWYYLYCSCILREKYWPTIQMMTFYIFPFEYFRFQKIFCILSYL